MKRQNLVTLCRVAVLIALELVLSRFLSLNTPTLRIGIGFLPIALCGILYGPYWSAAAWGIADIMGTLISGNAIFPPITLTYVLMGAVFGLFLHGKNVRFFPNVIICTLINTVLLSLGLNSYWLSLLQHAPYLPVMISRLLQCAVLIVLYFVLIPLLQKLAPKLDHIE